jgi:pimeloyl-ACP methyl ester carboxylesterase
MPVAEEKSALDTQISWKTLIQYARAVNDFTRTAAPELAESSFARIAAMSSANLPDAQFLAALGERTLGYRHYPASHTKTILVLVHGSGCFGDQMHEIARNIAGLNLAEVYTLNMRGHGFSEGPPGHAVSYPGQMVADLAVFIRHLRATAPDANIVLGGHSAGGGLVLAFSRTAAAAMVSGYLFLAPYLGLGSKLNRPHFGGWVKLRGLRLRLLTLANLFGIKRFNQATAVEFNRDACLREPRYTPSWSFTTMLAFGPGRWLDQTPPIPADKPVLVLAGEGDECFVQPLYPEAFRVIAPHAEIFSVGPGGHWDLLVEPKAIVLLGYWLAKQSTARIEAAPVRAAPTPAREASRKAS